MIATHNLRHPELISGCAFQSVCAEFTFYEFFENHSILQRSAFHLLIWYSETTKRIVHCQLKERAVPCSSAFHFSFVVGSPKKIQVLRTSGSVVACLARITACPMVGRPPEKSTLMSSWFITDCGPGSVRPEDAKTAIAPPWGARMSASARLSV